MVRTHVWSCALVVAVVLSASPAYAAQFAQDAHYTLSKDTTISDDLYAYGNTPMVSGTVDGDLAVAGGNVTVDGTVNKELFAAGGTVSMLGHVESTARIAGDTVTISGPVDGDLVIAGGTVTILPQATIGRDLVVMGGTVIVDGTVARNVTLRAGAATLNGSVGGTVDSESRTLTLGDKADIKGALTYAADDELAKMTGATTSSIARRAATTSTPDDGVLRTGVPHIFGIVFGLALFMQLIMFGTALIVLAILFRDESGAVVTEARAFWRALGAGFAALILVPIAGVILLATLFGTMLGLALLIAYALILVLAKMYAAIVVGAWFAKWSGREYGVYWTWSLLALLVLKLLALIPVVGWVVGFAVFLVSLGAIAQLIYRRFSSGLTMSR